MKTDIFSSFKKTLFIAFISILFFSVNSKGQIWSSFSVGENIRQTIKQDQYLWVLTNDAGLFKVNMQTKGVTQYNSSNSGLSNSTVQFAIDSSGHLWFATTDTGLVKFDGAGWTVYSTSNSDIYTDYLYNVAADKDGNIWAESDSKLIKFDGSTWTSFDHTYMNTNAMAIEYKADSTIIWMGTGYDGLLRFNGTNFSEVEDPMNNISTSSIEALTFDLTGKLWIGTGHDGIFVKDDTTFTRYTDDNSNLSYDNINSFTVDDSNHVWCAVGNENVSVFKGDTFNTISNTYNIKAIEFDEEGNLWFGYYSGGLAIYNPVTHNQTSILLSASIPNNIINAIATDAQGNKWIGTENGIAVYDGSWQTYDTTNTPLESNEIEAIVKDNSNNMWIGIDGHGLAKYDGATWTTYTMSNSELPSNHIEALDIDNNGNVWIGTYSNGLAKYSNNSFTEYNTMNSDLPNDYINDVKYMNNSIYACTENGLGILNLETNTWTTYNTTNSNLPDDDVYAVAQDKSGNLWIGTYGEGVVRIVGDTWINFNYNNSGLNNNSIYDIIINNAGEIWIATARGISKPNLDYWTWDNFTQYNSKLIDDATRCLFYDESESSLWIGTNGGLSIYGSQAYADISEHEKTEPGNITIYPNPVHNNLYINTSANIRQIIVSNSMGSQVIHNTYQESQGEYMLNMENLKPGLYIITLVDDNQHFMSKKILKQ